MCCSRNPGDRGWSQGGLVGSTERTTVEAKLPIVEVVVLVGVLGVLIVFE